MFMSDVYCPVNGSIVLFSPCCRQITLERRSLIQKLVFYSNVEVAFQSSV